MDQGGEGVTWAGGLQKKGLMEEVLKGWQGWDKTEASETVCPEEHDVSIEVLKKVQQCVQWTTVPTSVWWW